MSQAYELFVIGLTAQEINYQTTSVAYIIVKCTCCANKGIQQLADHPFSFQQCHAF